MHLKSLKDCELAIGSYPKFKYNATGGGGEGLITSTDESGLLKIDFNPESFVIPPLNWRTTRIMGLPIPPGLEIKVISHHLEGTIEQQKGEITLELKAEFIFTIFSTLEAPALLIETSLKSKKVKSRFYEAIGLPIKKNGLTILSRCCKGKANH